MIENTICALSPSAVKVKKNTGRVFSESTVVLPKESEDSTKSFAT